MAKPEPEARVFCIFLGIFVPPPELGPEWVGDRLCVGRKLLGIVTQGCIFGASIFGAFRTEKSNYFVYKINLFFLCFRLAKTKFAIFGERSTPFYFIKKFSSVN